MITRERIRQIWQESRGLARGMGIHDGCACAINTVRIQARNWDIGTGVLDDINLDFWRIVKYNDQFFGSMEDRRDLMIAHLDAGRLDLK